MTSVVLGVPIVVEALGASLNVTRYCTLCQFQTVRGSHWGHPGHSEIGTWSKLELAIERLTHDAPQRLLPRQQFAPISGEPLDRIGSLCTCPSNASDKCGSPYTFEVLCDPPHSRILNVTGIVMP